MGSAGSLEFRVLGPVEVESASQRVEIGHARQRAVLAVLLPTVVPSAAILGAGSSGIREVRERGLWAGVEFASLPGREACERLAELGVLAKDTHGSTIRLAPPLVIEESDLDWALDRVEEISR